MFMFPRPHIVVKKGKEYAPLKLVNINAQGLINKYIQLKDLLTENDIDICCITETWLDNTINDCEFTPQGYLCFRKDRQLDFYTEGTYSTLNRGGAAIIVKSSLNPTPCTDIDPRAEFAVCNIEPVKGKTIMIGSVYRPDRGKDVNLDRICDVIDENRNMNCIIAGDLNFPNIDWDTETSEDRLARRFLDNLQENHLHNVSLEPTRNKNVLDLILTGNPDLIYSLKVEEPLGRSDHNAVYAELRIPVKKINSKTRKIYLYSKGNYDALNEELIDLKFEEKLKNLHTHEAWEVFKYEYDRLVEKYVPHKLIKMGQKRTSPWRNCADVKKSSKMKRNLWVKSQKSKMECDKIIYKDFIKQHEYNVCKAKSDYEDHLVSKLKTNPKLFYNYARNFTKTSCSIDFIEREDGEKECDPQKISNILNEYFISVMTKNDPLTEDLPIPGPLPAAYLSEIIITEEDVMKKINSMKFHKSSGPDNIHINVIKNCTGFATPLKIIFNKSMRTGQIPRDWKDANICAIHKKGAKSRKENYRPVSLTSQIVKIMEKIILDRLWDHINSNDLLSCHQHGFQAGCSCVTQMLECLNDWTNNLNDKKGTDIIYLDFSKAFDSVSHSHLIYKLKHYGIRGHVLEWFGTFLRNRRQRVVSQQCFSPWSEVISGVPQGSICGPLLFLLYVNDIPEAIRTNAKLFADDTKLYNRNDTEEERFKLQEDLNMLNSWSKTWLLNFNADKCTVVSVHPKKNENYYLNGQSLKHVNQQKDLGILITDDLKPSKHIDSICKSANNLTGLVKRCFTKSQNVYREKEKIEILYKSIIRPKLEYGSVIWSPWMEKDKIKLEKQQKKFLALSEIEINLPSLEQRRRIADMSETFKIMNNEYKLNPENMFRRSDNILRGHSKKLFKPSSRIDAHKNFYCQRVITPWNKLPEAMVVAQDAHEFRSKMKRGTHL